MALNRLLLTFTLMFSSHLSSNTVFSGTNKPTEITVKKGHSVHLAIQRHENEMPQFDDLEWLKDDSLIVISYDVTTVHVHSSYKERVDFNISNYSLTLKNTQETDSGLYTARTSGNSEIIIGNYNVIVDTRTTVSHGTTGSVSLTWITFLVLLVQLFEPTFVLELQTK